MMANNFSSDQWESFHLSPKSPLKHKAKASSFSLLLLRKMHEEKTDHTETNLFTIKKPVFGVVIHLVLLLLKVGRTEGEREIEVWADCYTGWPFSLLLIITPKQELSDLWRKWNFFAKNRGVNKWTRVCASLWALISFTFIRPIKYNHGTGELLLFSRQSVLT